MFEQAFKNIDDVLWKDAGCTSELDYTEQTSWLLFLKYLDALETDRATAATLNGKAYAHILDKPYRWESWAAPKGKDGKIDHNAALTGDDLIAFVNTKLFPYLHGIEAPNINPGFNPVEFDGFRKQAGLNSFTLTPKQWIERTRAIGIQSKAGRYGENIRDQATGVQLVCLSNLENLNALFISVEEVAAAPGFHGRAVR